MKQFNHVHSSSRYDRSKASLSAAVDAYIEDCSIATFTEVADNERAEALIREGWTRIISSNGGYDDCGIMFWKNRWTMSHRESFHMGGGRYAQIVVLRDILTQKKLVLAVAHFPAHIESDMARRARTTRTALWNTNVVRLRMRVNRLKRKYRAHAAMITGDWNLDIKKRWVRVLIKALFPNWRNTWTAPFPAGGTHTNRIIDFTLIKGKIRVYEEPRLMADDGSSDHRPFREALRLTL